MEKLVVGVLTGQSQSLPYNIITVQQSILCSITLHIVYVEVGGCWAISGLLGVGHSSSVAQLPAGHVSVLQGEAVITDWLAVDHDVSLLRAGSPNQCHYGGNDDIHVVKTLYYTIFHWKFVGAITYAVKILVQMGI